MVSDERSGARRTGDLKADDGAESGLDGFIARPRGCDTVFFIYLSYQTKDTLQRWAANIEYHDVRERFEHDMIGFFSSGEALTADVYYAELRALVLADDRAIFKFMAESALRYTPAVCA